MPLLLLIAVMIGSLNCRKAEGVAVDRGEPEAEEALVAYLRIDTSNPPGNETNAARYLQSLLQKNGVPAQLVGSDPARQSVYARLHSGATEPALVLMHHMDVVPADVSAWTKPPFEGLRENGYIWGRGALDVKSLGIANLMAFLDLKRRGAPLRRDVIFLGVADEELGGAKGAEELLAKRPDLFTNVGYVINEGGSNETVIDRVTFWGIEIQQKVPLWLRLEVSGTGGHASAPPDDGGPLGKLVRALSAIQAIETPYRFEATVERTFREIGAVRRDARGALIRKLAPPFDPVALAKDFGPGYRALLHDTIAITRIDGGTSINSIPTRATADVDIRLLPDSKPEEMLARVQAAAGPDIKVQTLLRGTTLPPSATNTELFALLGRHMRTSEPGSVVAPIVVQGTSDSRFFRARGITAYGIAPFKVNYFDADSIHGNDERIRARFFADGVRLMRGLVRDFCVRDAGGAAKAARR